MAKRMMDAVTAAGVLVFVILTLQMGLRLMAFHK
jgi:hypothetical protein